MKKKKRRKIERLENVRIEKMKEEKRVVSCFNLIDNSLMIDR